MLRVTSESQATLGLLVCTGVQGCGPGAACWQSRQACRGGYGEQLLSEHLQLLNSGLGARVIDFGKENHCVYYILFLSHTNFLICVMSWHLCFSITG